MNQCEETEEGVHPSETPLCGQHDNQTKAQRLDSLESLSSDLKKNVTISDDSSDDGISLERKDSSKYRRMSSKRRKTFNRTAFKKKRPDFRDSSSSDSKKVAAADGDSVLSSDSWLDSLESLSSDLKKDSFRSSDRRISLERKVSSKYRHVSSKRRKTFNRTAFKKIPDDKCAFRPVSLPPRLDSSDSSSSDSKKKVATADRYSVLSSDSGLGSLESLSSDLKKDSFRSSDSRISLGRKVSSKYRRVSRKEKARSYHNDIDFKKNPDDKSSFRPVSLPPRLDFSESLFSHLLKDVAAGDRYSVLSSYTWLDSLESLSSDLKKASFRSSDRRISLERKVSSKYRRVFRKERQRSYQHNIDFKKNPDHKCAFRAASLSEISLERKVSSGSSCESGKKEKEKMTPSTTQELVVGSSAGIET